MPSDGWPEGNSSQENQDGSLGPTVPPTYRFSHFLRSLSVDFDRFRNSEGQNVEWKKPETTSKNQSGSNSASTAEFDEFTFKRNGDENMNVMINLYRHESPERYQLSPELAEVVDMPEATQQEAVVALWEYIRFWGLQEDEEKRNFRCDENLRKVWPLASSFINPRTNFIPGCWKRRYWVYSNVE
jgi:SWI/SNF-related matrix-associated actin-dependent regulator of chromatin subfamily D